MADHIGRLLQSVRASMANPKSPSSQLGLINASQAIIQRGKMIAARKLLFPPSVIKLQLAYFAKQTATCLADLRTTAAKVMTILLIID